MLRILPILTILTIISIFFLTACENDFSPKSDYEEQIVIFSVLDRSAAYQVVRLERTFDAESTNPDNPIIPDPVTEASVEITATRNNSTSKKTYVFKDTLFTLGDGSQKKVWISWDIPVSEGFEYALTVDVPGYERISAFTQVPSRAYAALETVSGAVRLRAVDNTAYPASGYFFRMWVTGSKIVDGETVEVRREVPVRITATDDYEFSEPTRDKAVNFTTGNLMRIHSELRTQDGAIVRDIVGVAYSLDQYIYSYYKLARGFDDPVSVRQDRPDISNVRNGVGIFGAVYPDSVRARFSSVVQQ